MDLVNQLREDTGGLSAGPAEMGAKPLVWWQLLAALALVLVAAVVSLHLSLGLHKPMAIAAAR